jgi:hypothetical protein
MGNQFASPLIDYDDLRREIAEAIRLTLRELAAENAMSYEDFLHTLRNIAAAPSNAPSP